MIPFKIIYKHVPTNEPVRRRVIIERLPAMPAKPPNIIVERWLPYKQQKRQVIYEKSLSNQSTPMESQMKSLTIHEKNHPEPIYHNYSSTNWTDRSFFDILFSCFVCLFNWLYNMKVDVEMKMCNNKMNMNAFDVWIGAVFEQQNTCEFLIQDNESNEMGKQIRLNNEEKIDLVFTWSFFTEFRVIWWQSKISKRRSCWQVSK